MVDGLVITHLDVVTSTSDHLLDALKNGAPEGTAFRANVQTKGRGRRGRDWQSPRGNLYVSILLKPKRPMAEWASLSLVASLALRDAIIEMRKASDVKLKWPNDVLYQGQKCAGLLLEVQDGAVLLGCGVNLDTKPEKVDGWQPGSLNSDIGNSDTGNSDTGNSDIGLNPITADQLMAALSSTLTKRYKQWCDDGFNAHLEDWHDAAAHLGQDLMIDQGHGNSLTGQFTGLNHDGSLCLITADGVNHSISAGDVVRARLSGYDNRSD